MKKIIILSFFLIIVTACNSGSCNSINTHFASYKDAVEIIEKSDFKIEENLDTSKSSWIESARYYSCDGDFGYLIVTTRGREYIYQNLPIELWNDFKKANSFGGFFNKNIKGNYQIQIN